MEAATVVQVATVVEVPTVVQVATVAQVATVVEVATVAINLQTHTHTPHHRLPYSCGTMLAVVLKSLSQIASNPISS